jgi:cell division protein FtsA
MKERSYSFLALYIGSSKLVALRAQTGAQGQPQIESWQKREPKGFEKGLIIDSESAAETMGDLLQAVAGPKPFGQYPLYVCLSNAQIKSYPVSTSLYFPMVKTIRSENVTQVMRQTKTVATLPLDEVIFRTVPQEYLVNDLVEIRNPVGLEGKRLGVAAHLFTLPVTAHRAFANLFDRLEIETEGMFPRGLGSTSAVLDEEERREGVLLLEMGADLSELLLFHHGSLRYHRIFPVGGESITRRVASEWGVPLKQARRLKEAFASLDPEEEVSGEETIPFTDEGGGISLKLSERTFREVVAQCVQTEFAVLEKEIGELKGRYLGLRELVASGGAMQMDGFLEYLQRAWKIPARLGFATGLNAPQELIASPGHNAILGLIRAVASGEWEEAARTGDSGVSRWAARFRDWLRDYF